MPPIHRHPAAERPPTGKDVVLHIPGSGRAAVVIGHWNAGTWFEAGSAGESYSLIDVEPLGWWDPDELIAAEEAPVIPVRRLVPAADATPAAPPLSPQLYAAIAALGITQPLLPDCAAWRIRALVTEITAGRLPERADFLLIAAWALAALAGERMAP